ILSAPHPILGWTRVPTDPDRAEHLGAGRTRRRVHDELEAELFDDGLGKGAAAEDLHLGVDLAPPGERLEDVQHGRAGLLFVDADGGRGLVDGSSEQRVHARERDDANDATGVYPPVADEQVPYPAKVDLVVRGDRLRLGL